MCGIVGYLGNKSAKDVIIKGLKRLEYRGYDSAGISTLQNNKLEITKTQGKVSDLIAELSTDTHTGGLGIGHTRWATMVFQIIKMRILIVTIVENSHWFTME